MSQQDGRERTSLTQYEDTLARINTVGGEYLIAAVVHTYELHVLVRWDGPPVADRTRRLARFDASEYVDALRHVIKRVEHDDHENQSGGDGMCPVGDCPSCAENESEIEHDVLDSLHPTVDLAEAAHPAHELFWAVAGAPGVGRSLHCKTCDVVIWSNVRELTIGDVL